MQLSFLDALPVPSSYRFPDTSGELYPKLGPFLSHFGPLPRKIVQILLRRNFLQEQYLNAKLRHFGGPFFNENCVMFQRSAAVSAFFFSVRGSACSFSSTSICDFSPIFLMQIAPFFQRSAEVSALFFSVLGSACSFSRPSICDVSSIFQ